MAGASSEAAYVNTGTAEISSHPEIEAVEAPGDSEEVCKTSKTEGLRKATGDSDWYRALARKDCKILMGLLEVNPCLVAQTGPEGETVVHAAAERGCLKLLYQVFDLFEKHDKEFAYKMLGAEVTWLDLIGAEYGPFQVMASDMAWFTFPRQAWYLLSKFDGLRDPKSIRCSFGASRPHHLRDKLYEIMQGEPCTKAFQSLERGYESNLNYNFVLEYKELQFHYALELMGVDPTAKDYVKTIMQGCTDLEASESVEVLKYLFQLHNAQGQTPIHVVSKHGDVYEFLKLMPRGDAYNECINAKDVRGWTILHYFVATKNGHQLPMLLQDGRIDVNARTSILWKDQVEENMWAFPLDLCLSIERYGEIGMTALHLAILHDDVTSVEYLLKRSNADVNALFFREITCGHENNRLGFYSSKYQGRMYWSPLQLAAMKGLSGAIRELLASKKIDDICNYEKLEISYTLKKPFRKVSALLLACASGNPDILRLFLDKLKCNPLVTFEGATALHYATNAELPEAFGNIANQKVGRFLYLSDLGQWDHGTNYRYRDQSKDIKLSPRSYLGKQACITILLQAGVDIWEKDDYDGLADPGLQAPEEILLWWHEQMARETLEAKKSLNDAANAISVVAALVATASFVGPLQPPLGYGGDSMEGGVQDTHLSIRVFMVSNILSFYFAVASILFAVVPSLPMPQEGIYAEWQRTRKIVGMAIFFLLLSVLGVLISFGTASNLVVSKDYSWQHGGLSFYPTLVGGFICILGISLFFIRLLRLVFHKNAKISFLYKTFVKL